VKSSFLDRHTLATQALVVLVALLFGIAHGGAALLVIVGALVLLLV
jgi:hypothetical protein